MANGFNINEAMNIQLTFAHSAAQLRSTLAQIRRTIENEVYSPRINFRPQAFAQMRREIDRTTDSTLALLGGMRQLGKQLKSVPAELVTMLKTTSNGARTISKDVMDSVHSTKKLTDGVNGVNGAVKTTSRSFDVMDASFARWVGNIWLFTKAVQGFKSQLDFSKEITKFAQVADQSVGSVLPFARNTQNLGMKYGANSRNILAFSTTLKQAGLGTNETKQYAEAIAQMSLSSQISNVEELGKPTVILRNNMGMKDPEDAINALGKLLQISKDYPVGLGEITSGLEKAGSVFRNDFNSVIAAITTASSITQQSGQISGTAIRSLKMRSESPRVLDNLRKLGVDLTGPQGQILPFSERLKRLSGAVSPLEESDPKRANIMAEFGLHHQATISALVDNYGEYLAILNKLDAINGAESIFREADIAAGSLNNQLDKTKEAFAKFFSNALFNESADNALKGILKTTTSLVDKLSGLAPLFMLLAGKYGASKASGFIQLAAPAMFKEGGLTEYASKKGALKGLGRAALSRGGLATMMLGASYAAKDEGGITGVAASATMGASSAALLGFGPWGIALGASTLALSKFADQVEEADKSLKDKAVAQQGEALRKSIDLGQATSIKKQVQSLVNEYEGQTYLAKNINNGVVGLNWTKNLFTADWGKLSWSAAREEVTNQRLENTKGRFGELSDVLGDLTTDTAKQFNSFAEFNKSQLGKNLIKLGVAAGADEEVLSAHIKTLIESNLAERVRTEAIRNAEIEAKRTAEALNALSSSVFQYESGLSKTRVGFESQTPDKLKSLSSAESFIPQLSLAINSPKFRSSFGQLGLDANTNKLLDQLKSVADILPAYINKNRPQLGGSSDRLGTMLLSNPLMKGLDNTITQVLTNTAKEMGDDEWVEGLASPNTLAQKLLSRFNPLLSELEKTGQAFTELRTRSLENLKTVLDQRNLAIGARANARTATMEASDFAKQVAYSRGASLRPSDFLGPERIIQEQVRSMTGGVSGVGSIAAQIRAFSEQLKQTGDGRFALGINNATQALQLLANTSQRLSSIQSELARVEGFKQGKLGYAEQYYGSDIQSRMQMDRQTAAAVMAISQGRTVHNTSVQTQQEVIAGLRLMRGTGPLDSLGGRTAEQAMEKFLGVDTRKEDAVINKLQDQMLRIMKDGAAAQWEIAKFEKDNFQFLISNLDKQNQQFLAQLAQQNQQVNAAAFANAVAQFNGASVRLEKAIANIPDTIELAVNNARMEVVHIGVSWMKDLEPHIKNIVKTQIQNAIGKNNRANPTRPPQMS